MKREEIRVFKVISDAKKTSFHLSMKQGLFIFLIQNILPEDKDFYPGKDESEVREQKVFLQNLFSAIGANFFILPIFQFLSQKLKGRRIKRKKKIEKIKKKNRKHFLPFFQLLLSFFSPKKKKRGKR